MRIPNRHTNSIGKTKPAVLAVPAQRSGRCTTTTYIDYRIYQALLLGEN